MKIKNLITLIGAVAILSLSAVTTKAVDTEITWTMDAADESKIDGFRVQWGTTSGNWTNLNNIADPSARSFILDIPVGQTRFVIVRTYKGTDLSTPSNEEEFVGVLPVPQLNPQTE